MVLTVRCFLVYLFVNWTRVLFLLNLIVRVSFVRVLHSVLPSLSCIPTALTIAPKRVVAVAAGFSRPFAASRPEC